MIELKITPRITSAILCCAEFNFIVLKYLSNFPHTRKLISFRRIALKFLLESLLSRHGLNDVCFVTKLNILSTNHLLE